MDGMQIVVEHIAGRIPAILGVQGASGHHAAIFARHAQALGADGVIAMAPYVEPIEDEDTMVHYYQAIDREVNMPIFIQNHLRGSELSIDTVVRLINEVEHIEYVKEEVFPPTHMATGIIERAGPKLKGVFGGASGRYLLLEHPARRSWTNAGLSHNRCRGAPVECPGNWRFERGKRIYGIMAPLFALETIKGTNYPEILRRRQVIKSSHSRLTTRFPTQTRTTTRPSTIYCVTSNRYLPGTKSHCYTAHPNGSKINNRPMKSLSHLTVYFFLLWGSISAQEVSIVSQDPTAAGRWSLLTGTDFCTPVNSPT